MIVRHSTDSETLILEELGLRHGAARIDLAVVNGILHGYEIKSDMDTLTRLPRQARTYNLIFDRATLVVGQRHEDKAIRIVPEWWGVLLANKGAMGDIQFFEIRMPRNNPSVDVLSVAKLLWREEALALLNEMGASDGVRSKPRAAIYARLAGVAHLDLVRARVHRQFMCRSGWRSGVQRKSNDG